jgi:hypothetical protein
VFPKFRYRVPGESIRNVAARWRGAWFVTKWPASIKQLIPGQSVVLYLSNLRHLYITPALMQVLQVVLTLKTQPRSQVALRILLLRRPPITKETKPVLTLLVSVFKVLPLRLSQDSRQVRSTAGPDTVDACSRSSAVVPRAALAAHVCAGEECIAIGHEVVCSTLGRCRSADPLRRDLAEQFGDVCCLDLGTMRDGA